MRSPSKPVKYETLEKLDVPSPVDRIDYVAAICQGRIVLDIGCYDETALVKRETGHWLHGRIVAVAQRVVGVDSSSHIPHEGIETGKSARIYCGDGLHLDGMIADMYPYDLIVAGEFIEHLENPLEFFRAMKARYAGRELVVSTPNGSSFANALLGIIGREVQHPDHLANFSFKILNTLCLRSGVESWQIIPYRFYATEMILRSTGVKRLFVQLIERLIRGVERLFPLLSFGYIVRIRL